MLNAKAGTAETLGGRSGLTVPAGRRRTAIYGPYERREAGRYVVSFGIELHGETPSSNTNVAIVDVVGALGTHLIAKDHVYAGELEHGLPVRLEFDLPAAIENLEYRVTSTGAADLWAADDPQVEARPGDAAARTRFDARDEGALMEAAMARGLRVEDALELSGPPPAIDERELAEELRADLRLIAPQRVVGHRKVRIGSQGDGGYVCLDDLDGIDTILSFGINDNVDFDDAVVVDGRTIYQFDHTVEAPRPGDARMVFEKKMIAPAPGKDCETLPALVRRHDRGGDRPNILLKIDIEDWEWPVLDAIDPADLARIRQITGEFHAFEYYRYPVWRARLRRVLRKLAPQFALIHVHGNNFAATTTIGDVTIPNVMEMTFVNRDCYELVSSDEHFPTPLDVACRTDKPDYELGAFRF